MTSPGTFCLGHYPIWALSAYFLGLGQAVGKGIPTLDNQPSTENTILRGGAQREQQQEGSKTYHLSNSKPSPPHPYLQPWA